MGPLTGVSAPCALTNERQFYVTRLTRYYLVTYRIEMEAIFKALADDTRRALLDMLHKRDGQTLSELEQQLGMTRFGVMKHLKVLEDASLVVTQRSGRFKHHYLNAIPLQQVIDRWIEPLTQKPMARIALDLKAQLEGADPMDVALETKPDFVLETFIKTTPEALWDALTNSAVTPSYFSRKGAVRSDLKKGSRFDYFGPDGSFLVGGEILDIVPNERLDAIFEPGFAGPDAPPSRFVYQISPVGNVCKFTILHFGIPAGQESVKQGWARIASGLKTLLETGKALQLDEMA